MSLLLNRRREKFRKSAAVAASKYIVKRGKEKLRIGEEYIVIGLTTQSDMRGMKQVFGKIYPLYEQCKFSTN